MMELAAFPLELKTIDSTGLIEGLAAGIGDVDNGRDRIMPGAFAKTLARRGGAPLPMLLHHDHRRPVGVWTQLGEVPTGLDAKGRIISETRDGTEALALARAGALGGLSIGFQAVRKSYEGKVRHLHEIELCEISLVTVPMHDRSLIHSVKSITSINDIRDLLHEAGLSGRQAKAAAGAAWRAIHNTDEDDEAERKSAADLVAIIEQSAARIAAL